MKKLTIVLPIFTFALFCAITFVLGAIAGFFCVLALGSEDSEPKPECVSTFVCVSDFFKDKSKRKEAFDAQNFKREIAQILYEDFCSKRVSVGEIKPAPSFELNGDVVKVSIDVNSPILVFNVVRSLSFYFKVLDDKFVLVQAKLSLAKIPLPIAKIILKNILKKYLECDALNDVAQGLSTCKIRVENGFLVFEK